MSYIIREGKLVGVPELNQQANGPFVNAMVSVSDRERVHGVYDGIGSITYSLTLTGTRALRLIELARENENVRVLFCGRYRVREFDRRDGGPKGLRHEVRVDEIGLSLTGQRIRIEREAAPAPTAPSPS